jgi:hypothetical protein
MKVTAPEKAGRKNKVFSIMYDLIILGGGAAGIFASIWAKATYPHATVLVLEKTAKLLAKVRFSGGGRCNVTHGCFDLKMLVQNYPRGQMELLGPFSRFQPHDMIQWLENRGVKLKTEPDGRVFPITNSSETIIQCLLSEAKQLGVEIDLSQKICSITKDQETFLLDFENQSRLPTKRLLLATGSSKEGYRFAEMLGHTIQTPIPSLFTFTCPSSSLHHLSGLSLEDVSLTLPSPSLSERGPLLITHFGFSGPSVLKLSARGARYLAEKNYLCNLTINWLPTLLEEDIFQKLKNQKALYPDKQLYSNNPFSLPKKLWKAFLDNPEEKLRNISLPILRQIAKKLHSDIYEICGKTLNKEEFVTCGGVTLSEVNFKTMESKLSPGLFFAGEILDIDGLTGGFNFQNAWTTAYLAGTSI